MNFLSSNIQNKNAQIPLMKALFIILLISILFLLFTIYLYQASHIPQKETIHEIAITNSLITQCITKELSEKYKIETESIKSCIGNIPSTQTVKINILNNKSESIKDSPSVFGNIESIDRFNDYWTLCQLSETHSCLENKLPLLYTNKTQSHKINIRIIG